MNNIYIYGPIEQGSFKQFLMNFKSKALNPGDTVNIEINSPGGYVDEGVRIADFIEENKSTYNFQSTGRGLVASIASYIYLSAPVRYIDASCEIMIHNPWTSEASGDASELQKIAKDLRIAENQIAKYYERKTKLSYKEVKELMKSDTFFSAEEAINFNFSTHLIKEKTKALALLNPMNFSKYFDKIKGAKAESQPLNMVSFDVDGVTLEIDFEGENLMDSVGSSAFYGGEIAPAGNYETVAGVFEIENGAVASFSEYEDDEQAEETPAQAGEKEKEEMNALNDLTEKVNVLEAQLSKLAELLESSISEARASAEAQAAIIAKLESGNRRTTKFTPIKRNAVKEVKEAPKNTAYSAKKFNLVKNLK